jgi:SAM-dependent methyltransferase
MLRGIGTIGTPFGATHRPRAPQLFLPKGIIKMATPPKNPKAVRKQLREGWTTIARNWEVPVFGAEVWAPREHLLTLAGIRRGQRVLDLACGTGNAALVERVGSEGYVLGLDLTPAMVQIGQGWVQQHDLRNVEFRVIESELELTVPAASFDVATCSFGLMYMPDPVGALRAVHQALKPGGRAAVSTWAASQRCPFLAIPLQVASRHIDHPALDPTAPGPLALSAPEVLERIFTAARFIEVTIVAVEVLTAWESPDAYWDFIAAAGWPLAMILPSLSEAVHQAIRDDVLTTLGAMFPRQAVRFTNETLVAAGSKAG